MGLKKGQTNNPNGKPPGALNKMSRKLRQDVTTFLEENFDLVVKEWKKLKGKDKVNFYRELLQYSIPKMQSVGLHSEFDNLSDDDLRKLADNILNHAEDENLKYEPE